MAHEDVERLLSDGGSNKAIRMKYDFIDSMEDFTAAALEDGYDFTVEDLVAVLREAGDSFEAAGNPRRRQIWWT